MKYIGLILLVTTLLVSVGCSQSRGALSQSTIEVTGVIAQQGMTTYQYGTHVLENAENFYALKSEVLDLDQYLGRKVKLKAERVEGYPVDTGPVFLNVVEVEEVKAPSL